MAWPTLQPGKIIADYFTLTEEKIFLKSFLENYPLSLLIFLTDEYLIAGQP